MERLTGEIKLEPRLNRMFAHCNPPTFQRHTVQGVGEGTLKRWRYDFERIAANRSEQRESKARKESLMSLSFLIEAI